MNKLPILGEKMRVDTRPFLTVPPEIRIQDGPALPVETLTLRPFGGIFILPEGHTLTLGQQVRIRFFVGEDDAVTLIAATAETETTGDGRQKVLLNFLASVEHTGTTQPSKPEESIPCPKDYLPLAWGEHPWFFKHRLHFKIQSFLRGGMVLQFGEEAKAVGKKLTFEMQVVLPSIDVFRVKVEVIDTDYVFGRPSNTCSVRFIDPSPELLTGISRYLFANVKGITRSSAEALGYEFPQLEYASSFRYAYTEAQIEENLRLRLRAYRNRPGANLKEITEPHQMRDRFDDHALLFSIQVGGKAVGTGRLVLNNREPKNSEIGSLVDLPPWLWKAGFVEFSRFATDEEFRGRDVFANLGLHSARVAHQLGYRYVVADCEDSLLSTYKKRGARPLGITFVHPLEGVKLHVIYYDSHLLNLAGRILTPKRWARTWGAVLDYYRG